MALQSSGPISLGDIQTEFGGTNPISISEYYKGEGLVTLNNTNIRRRSDFNAITNRFGTQKFSNFYGGLKIVTLPVTFSVSHEASFFNTITFTAVDNSQVLTFSRNSPTSQTINVFTEKNYIITGTWVRVLISSNQKTIYLEDADDNDYNDLVVSFNIGKARLVSSSGYPPDPLLGKYVYKISLTDYPNRL